MRNRKINGQYDYEDLSLMCVCGHRLGIHSGLNDTGKRGCLNEDEHISGATGVFCDCENFKKTKDERTRKKA